MSGSEDPEREGPPKPPLGLASRERPRRASRYSIFVGIAFVVIVAVAVVNAVVTPGGGILGGGATDPGSALPQFAIPLATGSLTGDANVFQDDCEVATNPCPEDERRTPACEIEPEGAIRVCDLFDKPLVISFWFTGGGDCLPTEDLLNELAPTYRDSVNFLSINIRDDREEVRRVVEERRWVIPVGHDADGAVANVFRVGVCPTVAFAYPGGILADAAVGDELGREGITSRIDDLLAESERRAEVDR